MTGLLLVSSTIVCLSILVALVALSRWVADVLERRRCTCLFEPQPTIGTETDEHGVAWNVYPVCRMHARQQRTRINEETASGRRLAA